jgi:hypothetical protein
MSIGFEEVLIIKKLRTHEQPDKNKKTGSKKIKSRFFMERFCGFIFKKYINVVKTL